MNHPVDGKIVIVYSTTSNDFSFLPFKLNCLWPLFLLFFNFSGSDFLARSKDVIDKLQYVTAAHLLGKSKLKKCYLEKGRYLRVRLQVRKSAGRVAFRHLPCKKEAGCLTVQRYNPFTRCIWDWMLLEPRLVSGNIRGLKNQESTYTSTRTGRYLGKRVCKQFAESSHCLLAGSCSTTVVISENILHNLSPK